MSRSINDIFIHLAAQVSQVPYWRETAVQVRFLIEDVQLDGEMGNGKSATHSWLLDTTSQPKFIKSDASAACTVGMKAETFKDLISGAYNPQRAFVEGKLTVTGEVGEALKVWPLFWSE